MGANVVGAGTGERAVLVGDFEFGTFREGYARSGLEGLLATCLVETARRAAMSEGMTNGGGVRGRGTRVGAWAAGRVGDLDRSATFREEVACKAAI